MTSTHSAVTLITCSIWWNISPQAPLQIEWIQNLCKWRICISRVPTDNSAGESGFPDDFVGTGKSLSPTRKWFTFSHMCSSSVELLRIALYLWIKKVLRKREVEGQSFGFLKVALITKSDSFPKFCKTWSLVCFVFNDSDRQVRR